MAILYVQSGTGAGGGTTTTYTINGVTKGNFIAVAVSIPGMTAITSFTDNFNNTWAISNNFGTSSAYIYTTNINTSGNMIITIDITSPNGNVNITWHEYSGTLNTTIDKQITAQSYFATNTANSGSTSNISKKDEIVLSAIQYDYDSIITGDIDYSNLVFNNTSSIGGGGGAAIALQGKIVSSISTQNSSSTFIPDSIWGIITATYAGITEVISPFPSFFRL